MTILGFHVFTLHRCFWMELPRQSFMLATPLQYTAIELHHKHLHIFTFVTIIGALVNHRANTGVCQQWEW